MTSSKTNGCISCGSDQVELINLRDILTYNVCRHCAHCEKEMEGTLEDAFEDAQNKYFGEDTVLTQVTETPFEAEVMAKRAEIFKTFLSEKSAVLEVGPGGGSVLTWLLSQGHIPTAVEHSPSLSQHLAELYDIDVETGEFETIDLPSESFDAFCSFHVIEHVRDPSAHLFRAFEIVRSGGLAFIATPNASSWQQRVPGNLSPNYDSAHLRVYSHASLSKLACEAGWIVERTITPEYTVGWLRVVSKIMRRVKGEHEESTAGKYAENMSGKTKTIFRMTGVLTWPLRVLQAQLGGGNELFLILRKPDPKSTIIERNDD